MIFEIFSSKHLCEKNRRFLPKLLLVCAILDHNIGFEEKRHFPAKNWYKTLK
jgi:hypothetical protein